MNESSVARVCFSTLHSLMLTIIMVRKSMDFLPAACSFSFEKFKIGGNIELAWLENLIANLLLWLFGPLFHQIWLEDQREEQQSVHRRVPRPGGSHGSRLYRPLPANVHRDKRTVLIRWQVAGANFEIVKKKSRLFRGMFEVVTHPSSSYLFGFEYAPSLCICVAVDWLSAYDCHLNLSICQLLTVMPFFDLIPLVSLSLRAPIDMWLARKLAHMVLRGLVVV
jgi:hypothetical protein